MRVEGFLKVGERVVGVRVHDLETGERFEIHAQAGRQRDRRVDG